MTLIYPGGGNCDPNEEPCVGPDCGNPPIGDPDNPIVDDGCLINCGGPTTCTGPCCVNDQCICDDCSYGEDGDWHAYWVCNPDAVGSNAVVAGEVSVAEPQNGGLTNLEGQNLHFALSNAGFDSLGLPLIQIGDSFQYIDPNDFINIGEDGDPIITQYPCFTYLGKKDGVTWNQASPPGMVQLTNVWATGATDLGPSAGSPVSNSFTPYTNYSTNGEPCLCQATPDPPQSSTGCQDPAACNYSHTVTIHDQETCCYVAGCNDDYALNYNINACCNDDSCCYIGGCTDGYAINYNINACYDDSSCCYTTGCTDSTASNYDEGACEEDGSCIYGDLYTYGIWCSTVSTINQNGDLVVVTETSYNLYDTSSDNWGCTDTAIIAPGYSIGGLSAGAMAIVVPGMNVVSNDNVFQEDRVQVETCTLFVGTMTGNDVAGPAFDLPLSATVSIPFKAQGMCPLGLGFTASNSLSKIVSTSFQEPSCGSCCDKITDPNCDSGGGDISGCMDSAAFNHNPNATIDTPDTCEWIIPRWSITSDTSFSQMPNQMIPDVNPPGVSAVDHYIFHADDLIGHKIFSQGQLPSVLDYFHSTGIYTATGATLSNAQYFGVTYRDSVVSGTIPQANDVVQFNYSNASTGDSSVSDCMRYLGDDVYTGDGGVSFASIMGPTRFIAGPMRPTAYTFPNVTSTTITDNCLGSSNVPSGCTDPDALNYDSYASLDDGTCEYTSSGIMGCTDDGTQPGGTMFGSLTRPTAAWPFDGNPWIINGQRAINYDVNAVSDDSSCQWCTWSTHGDCATHGVCQDSTGYFVDVNNSNLITAASSSQQGSLTLRMKSNGGGIARIEIAGGAHSVGGFLELTENTSYVGTSQHLASNGWTEWSITLALGDYWLQGGTITNNLTYIMLRTWPDDASNYNNYSTCYSVMTVTWI